MEAILQGIWNQSFIQSTLLVIITAAIVDLLVPRVKAKMDQDKFEREKRFEEEMARRTKLREDRMLLLDGLEEQLWEYQYLLLEPSYYVIRGNEPGFRKAFTHYDERASALLAAISAKISKLSRLADPETHQRFQSLRNQLTILDGELIRLAEASNLADLEQWNRHHNRAYMPLGGEIEAGLLLLAQNFDLTQKQAEYKPSKP